MKNPSMVIDQLHQMIPDNVRANEIKVECLEILGLLDQLTQIFAETLSLDLSDVLLELGTRAQNVGLEVLPMSRIIDFYFTGKMQQAQDPELSRRCLEVLELAKSSGYLNLQMDFCVFDEIILKPYAQQVYPYFDLDLMSSIHISKPLFKNLSDSFRIITLRDLRKYIDSLKYTKNGEVGYHEIKEDIKTAWGFGETSWDKLVTAIQNSEFRKHFPELCQDFPIES